MPRTRTALLAAAERCVERHGARATTMAHVALEAAVAKGTLYNHFRTKDDVLAALVRTRAEELAAACRDAGAQGLVSALELAGRRLSASGALRRVAADEPALAARLAGGTGRGWDAADDGVRAVLRATGSADGDDAVDLVLRWLASLVLRAGADDDLAGQAERLAAALARG
jgi:AcrR family transcriptional regulator